MPRAPIIATRFRKLSLKLKYQRTHRTATSWSKCQPLNNSSVGTNRGILRASSLVIASRFNSVQNSALAGMGSPELRPSSSSESSRSLARRFRSRGSVRGHTRWACCSRSGSALRRIPSVPPAAKYSWRSYSMIVCFWQILSITATPVQVAAESFVPTSAPRFLTACRVHAVASGAASRRVVQSVTSSEARLAPTIRKRATFKA
jgi:hypothetical protein